MILLKRAYEKPEPSDGFRVLVDRLWPRGVAKAELALDAWDKDVAPSPALRTWFHADPIARWPEFKKRYRAELRAKKASLRALRKSARRMTLVYGAKDSERNHALVLKEALQKIA